MEADVRQVQVASTRLYHDPSPTDIETEVLFGETVTVEGIEGAWARVTTTLDAYPGYVALQDLSSDVVSPTHRVNEVVIPVYDEPSFKKPSGRQLYMNSRVVVSETKDTPEGTLAHTNFGWVFRDQLMPIDTFAPDFVAECAKFVGCSYEWGARSRSLVDCSAFLQAGCIAAGILCPRNAKPQAQELGEPFDATPDFTNLVRGDLVFWTEGKGRHGVVMVDEARCLNASIAAPRQVRVHLLAEAMREQERDGNGSVTCVRRIPGYR